MSGEDVEVVRALIDGYNRSDLDAMLEQARPKQARPTFTFTIRDGAIERMACTR